ncbi:MAG: hypothetical protein M1816_007241 [Peltula sp. TS41687]|nr:MAG: hypothetical protein M1816_007241 [Peltula sp. TS41687]
MSDKKTTKKRGRGSPGGSRRPSDSDTDFQVPRAPKRARTTDLAPQPGGDGASGSSQPATGSTSARPRRTIRRPSRFADDDSLNTPPHSQSRRSRPRRRTTGVSTTATARLAEQNTSATVNQANASSPSGLSGSTLINSALGAETEEEPEQHNLPPFTQATPNNNVAASCDQNQLHFFADTFQCVGPHPVPYFVCTICVNEQEQDLAPVEFDAVQSHKIPICQACGAAERERRANGQFKLCQCLDKVKNGIKCDPCRITAMNEIRVAARQTREQSLRDGWREWLCAVCGAQQQGIRGGTACLACFGIDLPRTFPPGMLSDADPSLFTSTMSQFPS